MSFNFKTLMRYGCLAIAAAVSLAATPVKNNLVELSDFINARSNAAFRKEDANKLYRLEKGTRGVVQEVKHFEKTGNYGLCLKIVNVELSKDKDCYWVYYVESRATMKVFAMDASNETGKAKVAAWSNPEYRINARDLVKNKDIKEVKKPAPTNGVFVTKPTEAIKAPPTAAAAKNTDAFESGFPNPQTTETVNRAVIATAGAISQQTNQTVSRATPANDFCPGCGNTTPGKSSFEICAGEAGPTAAETGSTKSKKKSKKSAQRSDYLGQQISSLAQKEPAGLFAQLLADKTPAKYIKDSCFAGAMIQFGGPFKTCASPNAKPVLASRACVSDNYLSVTRKSFDLVGECLGEFMTGNSSTVQEGMRTVFALSAHESGLHSNAQSNTGAKGIGQFIEARLEHIEKVEMRLMRNVLNQKIWSKQLPEKCGEILKVVEKPFVKGNACSMLSLEAGNPLKNMAYVMLSQKMSRTVMRKIHLESGLARDLFRNMSVDERDYLERQIGSWAHNRGDGGTESVVRSYLARYPKRVLSKEDIPAFMAGLKNYMADPGRSNKGEPVKFCGEYDEPNEKYR